MNKKEDPVMAKRFENYESICHELENQKYNKSKSTISFLKANIMAFVTSGPVAVILFIIYFCVNIKTSENLTFKTYFEIMAALLVSIPVHEGIHGIFFALFCKKHFKSIEFGIVWKNLTQYCHCKEPLSILQYYIALLAPMLFLGIIPSVIAIVAGNLFLLAIGLINILMAGGDFTIAFLLLKYIGKKVKIIDHPIECGCVIFER